MKQTLYILCIIIASSLAVVDFLFVLWGKNNSITNNPVSYINQACKITECDSSNIRLENLLKNSFVYSLKTDSATSILSKAYVLNPYCEQIIYAYAICLYLNKESVTAAHVLQSKSILRYKETLWLDGFIAEQKHDTLECINKYAKLIYAYPDVLDSQFFDDLYQRNPYLALKAVSVAFCIVQKEWNKEHNPLIAAKIGKFNLYKGQIEKASKCFTYCMQQLPNLNRPYLYQGIIYLSQKDSVNAQLCFEQANVLDPADHLPNYYLDIMEHKTFSGNKYHVFYRTPVELETCYHSRLVSNSLIIPDLLAYLSPDITLTEAYKQFYKNGILQNSLYSKGGIKNPIKRVEKNTN